MKRLPPVLSFSLLFLLLFGCQTANREEPESIFSEPFVPDVDVESVRRGTRLYTTYCGFCHGSSGEGYLSDQANALNNPTFLATASDEFIEKSIHYGRPNTPMSAWSEEQNGPLSKSEIRDITTLIRSWQTTKSIAVKDPPPGRIPKGQALYSKKCASCHGKNGEGRSALSLNNPRFLDCASDGFLAYAIRKGRPETKMSAFESKFSSDQISDLVALLRSWATPVEDAPVARFSPPLESPLLNPEGPPARFDLFEDRFVSSDQVFEALIAGDALILIDARSTGDYLLGHIQGSLSIPFYRIDEASKTLPKDSWIVTYCACPHAISGQAADKLLQAGFKNVAVLDEGFPYWKQQGYPTLSGPDRGHR